MVAQEIRCFQCYRKLMEVEQPTDETGTVIRIVCRVCKALNIIKLK